MWQVRSTRSLERAEYCCGFQGQGKYESFRTRSPRAMILLTGATGLIGSVLLRRLLGAGEEVRCLVRDPRRLGPNRVRVNITLGDLASATSIRQAMRGITTVVHVGAAIRDQPGGSIEEVNGMATIRLLREAEKGAAERFVFFTAVGASPTSPARFMRAKALAERAVLSSDVESFVLAPSIVYSPTDRYMTLLRGLTRLPWVPIAGSGRSQYQPMWVEDAADCAAAVVLGGSANGRRIELAGPEILAYDDIVKLALHAWGRERPLVHVPPAAVRSGLRALERISGHSAFAAWEEAELMGISMVAERGPGDARRLGVEPKPMREVLGL
jgi:NADH dehydrogenase